MAKIFVQQEASAKKGYFLTYRWKQSQWQHWSKAEIFGCCWKEQILGRWLHWTDVKNGHRMIDNANEIMKNN